MVMTRMSTMIEFHISEDIFETIKTTGMNHGKTIITPTMRRVDLEL